MMVDHKSLNGIQRNPFLKQVLIWVFKFNPKFFNTKENYLKLFYVVHALVNIAISYSAEFKVFKKLNYLKNCLLSISCVFCFYNILNLQKSFAGF